MEHLRLNCTHLGSSAKALVIEENECYQGPNKDHFRNRYRSGSDGDVKMLLLRCEL
jgi:hypothetical protein